MSCYQNEEAHFGALVRYAVTKWDAYGTQFDHIFRNNGEVNLYYRNPGTRRRSIGIRSAGMRHCHVIEPTTTDQRGGSRKSPRLDWRALVSLLADANRASVTERYKNSDHIDTPYGERCVEAPGLDDYPVLADFEVVDALRGYRYQTCEWPEWENSPAHSLWLAIFECAAYALADREEDAITSRLAIAGESVLNEEQTPKEILKACWSIGSGDHMTADRYRRQLELKRQAKSGPASRHRAPILLSSLID